MKIIITESQFRFLIEQQIQNINIEMEDGSIKTFKSNSKEYANLYDKFQSGIYKWDGTKYALDYSKIIKNWNNMTPDQQKSEKLKSQKINSVGIYKENPNLITAGMNEIIKLGDYILSFSNELAVVLDFFIPGSGAIIDIINTMALLSKAMATTDKIKRKKLLLATGVSFAFIFMPGPLQQIFKPIQDYIRFGVELTQVIKSSLISLLKYVERAVIDLQGKVTNAVNSPQVQKDVSNISKFLNSSTIPNLINNFIIEFKNIINNPPTKL